MQLKVDREILRVHKEGTQAKAQTTTRATEEPDVVPCFRPAAQA